MKTEEQIKKELLEAIHSNQYKINDVLDGGTDYPFCAYIDERLEFLDLEYDAKSDRIIDK